MSANAFERAPLSRRTLLAGVGGASVVLGSGALSACSSGSKEEKNTANVNNAVALPTYIPFKGVTPDLPGTEQGVDPAFRNFPKDRPKSVEEKPGSGTDPVSGMAIIYFAVPPTPPQNKFWAGLNERMGIDLKLQMVPNADYTQKFATTIAGNELPDVLQFPNGAPAPVANMPQVLDKRFENLSEHLSGDAVKDYPNLANIPTRTWRSAIYNGGIYGIPIPRGAIGNYHFIRQDLFEAAGVSPEPKSYEELIDAGKALTDAKKRRWAYGLINQPRQLLRAMNAEPNIWANEGGKLTHQYETEQYKQTITDLIEMWKSGVMHPDSFNAAQPFKQLFNAGTVAINANDGYPGWNQYILDNMSNPNFKLGLMPIYTRDSGELAKWGYGSGFFAISAIKKQDSPDRVKMILRMLNYLAAPFGTEEYAYRLYGEEGVHHTINEAGNPVLTAAGTSEATIPVRYLADAPYTIFQPGRPDDADTQHAYQSLEIPTGIPNPTIGLFSNTAAEKNSNIDKNFNDGVNQIIQGRNPLTDLEGLVSTWRSEGGDQMRTEYQDQLQASGGN